MAPFTRRRGNASGMVNQAAAVGPCLRCGGVGGGCSEYPPEALDEWMTTSVKAIAEEVGETPLLVHAYDHRQGERRPRLEREKAKAGSWPGIVNRWKEGCPVPDEMILVEQLDAYNSNVSRPTSKAGSNESKIDQPASKDGSKMWGVLVQGRGLQCAASYTLKTDTVKSTMGYCTYICLARASSFGPCSSGIRGSLTPPFPDPNGSNIECHDHGLLKFYSSSVFLPWGRVLIIDRIMRDHAKFIAVTFE